MSVGLAELVRTALDPEPRLIFALGFGSRFSGNPRPGSDLDLGLWFGTKVGFADLAELCLRIERATGIEPVDLVLLELADPLLRFEALRGKLLLCRDWEAYARFFSLTCREHEEEMARLARFWHHWRTGAGTTRPGG
ncbi:MAG: nucleotidyltransferase domain-containing protein [Deltaproteobacteria bacterium]|nr:nucleotidyltransferase domain-containing protein [Deltaproteobacteria bacterium]